MTSLSFKERLEKSRFVETLRDPDAPVPRLVSALRDIAAGIQDNLRDDRIQVRLLPGYSADFGQQYRFQIGGPDGKFSTNLFRAYIPMDASQVTLDFYDDNPTVCRPEAEAIQEKVLEFLMRPATTAQLQQLVEYMKGQPHPAPVTE